MADVVKSPMPQNETTAMERQERVVEAMEVSDPAADEPPIEYPTGFKLYSLWAVLLLTVIVLGLVSDKCRKWKEGSTVQQCVMHI